MLIARLYNHYREQKVFAQREIVSKITIEEKIDSFWVAKMEIPITPGLDTGVKIELYEVGNKEDQLIFRGIVYEIKPVRQRWDMLEITVRWEESIFQKRKTLRKHTFTNQTLSSILEKLLTPYNTEFNEDWGFEVQKEENLTLEIEQGDDYADIFDEICKQKELFWRVVDGVIFFRKNGEDLRSTQLLEYDGCSANPGNIIAIELVGTSSGGNVALIEDNKWRITVDKSQYSGVLTGVVSKQIRKGDDSEKAKQFAKEQARPQRKYQIQVANSSIIANLWDRIKVEVVNTNSFYDYSGEAIVQSKTTSYSNASKVVVYGIQEFLVSPFAAENRVENVEKSIKLLRQRKGGGETPPPQVDLSWYATYSAVNQAIQSQNTKIEKKADSTFVQWVAQTAQTALNAANQAKQTAESKADANHNHDDRYYTESEIDNKLSGKADVNHTHNFPTSLPASDVYDRAKQANKPTYTISEIQGLQEALDNKSSSVASLNPTDRIRMPNHRGLHREANTDWAQILFRSNGNDDTSLDFKLGDDNSEFFRFMHNDTWRAAFNYELATYKQKFFAHAQFGEFPTISLAIWDSDTGFNWNGDGNFTMKANGADLNHFYNGRAPIVRQGMNNGEFQHLTQAQYDALGAGRPNNVIYYITD